MDAVLKSPQAKDGDEWCEKFSDLELHNAQFKVISRVRLDFKDFEEKYSVMSRRDIKALADPELSKTSDKQASQSNTQGRANEAYHRCNL